MPNWHEIFTEIQQQALQHQIASQNSTNIVRHKYLKALHDHTGRNVITYYSGWLSKPGIGLSEINDEDTNGFMTTIHKLDRTHGLDLILHTPGGGIAATQSIVNYLHKMFGGDIRAIVPQIAMSAGTIIACCCKEIWMGKQSSLGPVDPQLRGIPAHGVVQEFKRALREIKKDPSRIVIWQQIIGQYRPTFLSQCENAIDWSNSFVEQQLADGMFSGLPDRKKKAKKAAKELSNYPKNKTHDRHFDIDECRAMGLIIKDLESDPIIQDAALSVHHCYMNVLMNSSAYKIIENQNGIALVKHANSPIPSIPGQRAELPTEP
jgi:ATP-dependent protease ClpP protease subunit